MHVPKVNLKHSALKNLKISKVGSDQMSPCEIENFLLNLTSESQSTIKMISFFINFVFIGKKSKEARIGKKTS